MVEPVHGLPQQERAQLFARARPDARRLRGRARTEATAHASRRVIEAPDLGLVQFLPSLVLILVTGAVADRFGRTLDLDLLVINLAYGEERLERLTRFTGMSRKLIERCIRKG